MSRSSSSQPTRRLFVSLHWKGFFFLSVLLLTLSGFFAGLNYLYLKHQFAQQRAAEVKLLEKKIKGLLAQSSERLQHLGAVLATVGGLDQALATGDSASLTQIITERYASVQYEMDIGRIELFTAAGEHFWSWELIPFRTLPAELMRQSMARVYKRERPLTLLNCQPECALYAFVPILANGRNAGGIALAQSIAQIMIDFQQVTGADIGLMVPAFPSNGAHMPSWQMRFAVLTNAPMLRPLFEALSRQHTVDTLDRDAFYAWKGALYALHRIPLQQLTEAQDGAIVLISDVTEAINTILAAAHNGLIMAGCALVIAELLLLLLVRVPIRRLQQFAATLPLLAVGAYAEARQRLARQGVPVRLTDEIDIVYETAMTLSHQLEERTAALSIKNQELAKERDFVQGLLDSAHVLILTQTREGEIRTLNQFAETLIGYSAQELCGRYFRELVAEPEAGDELESKLQALWAGEQRRLQHESELLCRDSSRRHVVWVHTRLRETDPKSVAVLSVGLDVTDRVQAESRSTWLANHDPLTSLFNRHRFQEELERAFTRVARDGGHAALLFFDLDHFKDINDTSGHAAGDALLRLVANELRRRLRKGDIAGRLGGDEFAVLMPNTGSDGAKILTQDLNENLTQTPFQVGNKSYRISASIGIAVLPEHGETCAQLMANADIAMYQAKQAGRGRWHLFSSDDAVRKGISKRAYWKETLERALANRDLKLYFQPIARAATGEVAYYEALIRLQRQDGGIVLPAEFIDVAYRIGLISAIDCYVAEEALRLLSSGAENCPGLSINLSTNALSDPVWAEPLKRAVCSGALDPKRLSFEITETTAISDLGTARTIMDELTQLGFAFALDDFGVGFASFYYLKQLPIEFVKIDQSFVNKLVSNAGDRAFITAITTLAHGYGQKVVAEGVEDAKTLALLKDLGVDFVQGFYIGSPNPVPGTKLSQNQF